MEGLNIQTIIQGGAVGLAVLLIIYSAWKDQLYNKTLNNHLQHLDVSLNRLSNAIESSNRGQENLVNVLDQNTRIVSKSQEVMDKMVDKFLR